VQKLLDTRDNTLIALCWYYTVIDDSKCSALLFYILTTCLNLSGTHSWIKSSRADSGINVWKFYTVSPSSWCYPEDGDGGSSRNVVRTSHLDATVCPRKFHTILSPQNLQDLRHIVHVYHIYFSCKFEYVGDNYTTYAMQLWNVSLNSEQWPSKHAVPHANKESTIVWK
jgi:hypothetical protein